MDVKVDSRKIKDGDTFVAIKGITGDGHNYVEDAIKNGAKKVVVENGLYSVETLVVDNTREYLVNYLSENYNNKIKELKLIGVTGTNGKTTSCYLLWQALNKVGIKTSYIGTIGFYINDKMKDLNNTTPDILDLYEMFIESVDNGCKFVVMEVSSHSLSLGRVNGLLFDYVVFTNLTQDHLDYHKNMNDYALAKQILFRKVKNDGYAIINIDDYNSDYYLLADNNNITYGYSIGDYQIIDLQTNINNSAFKIKCFDKIVEFKSGLIGIHNIYNLLNVIIVLVNEKIDFRKIKEVIGQLYEPPGRLEKIKLSFGMAIVDYAHTPDAVEKIINCVKKNCDGILYTIVGCGGNRDRAKRPLMGKIATELSDYVIFTSDNPRYEKPIDIINDIIHQLDNKNYEIEENREKAIIKGIQKLTKNDILLVLGKGHEDYQIIGNNKIHFSDKEIILKYIGR